MKCMSGALLTLIGQLFPVILLAVRTLVRFRLRFTFTLGRNEPNQFHLILKIGIFGY